MKNNFFLSNRILYGIILSSSIFYVYYHSGFVPYTLFFTVLLLPIVSFLYTLIIYFRFKYDQSIDSRLITKGEKFELKYIIANEDFIFYPYIKTVFFSTGIQSVNNNNFISFSLLPFSKKSQSIYLDAKYIGRYKVGIEKIELYDFLGIFSLKFDVSKQKEITVYPRIINIDNFNFKKDHISEIDYTEKRLTEDMLNVSDIRKYAYGDSMKKIHWKLTARYDEFMVKNYFSTSKTCTHLLLDLFIDDNHTEYLKAVFKDQIIESALAIANYCVKKSIPLSVLYYKNSIIEYMVNSVNEFKSLYMHLAEIKFDGSIDISNVINLYLNKNTNWENLIIFTSNFNTSLLNVITKASHNSFNIKLFWINDKSRNKNFNGINIKTLRERLMNIGIELYNIGADDDIKNTIEAGKYYNL